MDWYKNITNNVLFWDSSVLIIQQQINIQIFLKYYLVMNNSSAQKPKYFTCTKSDIHLGQALNLICIDQICQNRGLICSICKVESHQNHRILPLRKFLAQINQKSNTKKSQKEQKGVQNIFEQIEMIKDEMLTQLQKTIQQLAKLVRQCQQGIVSYFLQVKRQSEKKIYVKRQLKKILDKLTICEYNSPEEAQSDIITILENLKQEKESFFIKIDLQQVISAFEKKKNLFESNMKLLLTDANSLLKTFSDRPTSQQTSRSNPFSKSDKSDKTDTKGSFNSNLFWPKNKGKSIKISNNNRQAKQLQNSSSRFAFVGGDALGLNKSNKILFKIKCLVNWIGVGIGVLDKIKNKQFSFDYNKLGHGSYLLSANGYTWSHSQTSENLQNKMVQFKINQIIQIQFNEPYTILTIKNITNGKKIDLTVKLTQQQLKNVYFCVNLCSIGDTVQIIDSY